RELEKWIKRVTKRFDGGEIGIKNLPERYISDILREDETDDQLPDLPLFVSLDEYIERIREKAREMAGGNMAEVDRLLKQKPSTERQRQYRRRK
ncbi:MAG: hypothetical protein ACE5I1_32580, partial [bacterium]